MSTDSGVVFVAGKFARLALVGSGREPCAKSPAPRWRRVAAANDRQTRWDQPPAVTAHMQHCIIGSHELADGGGVMLFKGIQRRARVVQDIPETPHLSVKAEWLWTGCGPKGGAVSVSGLQQSRNVQGLNERKQHSDEGSHALRFRKQSM
jgi:hypothetical protein